MTRLCVLNTPTIIGFLCCSKTNITVSFVCIFQKMGARFMWLFCRNAKYIGDISPVVRSVPVPAISK